MAEKQEGMTVDAMIEHLENVRRREGGSTVCRLDVDGTLRGIKRVDVRTECVLETTEPKS
jgi:hypothetical protein